MFNSLVKYIKAIRQLKKEMYILKCFKGRKIAVWNIFEQKEKFSNQTKYKRSVSCYDVTVMLDSAAY